MCKNLSFFSIIIPFSPLFFSEKLILECIIEQIARHQFKRWMNCKRALMVGKGKILASVVMILSWVIFSLPFSFYNCFLSLTWSVLYLFNLAFYFLNEVFEFTFIFHIHELQGHTNFEDNGFALYCTFVLWLIFFDSN